MQLVIIAGGKGTRLGLKDIPKPMCNLGGIPLLEYQIKTAKKYGINSVILSVGYKADKIISHFGNGEKFGIKIQYSIEDHPLGTAGGFHNFAKILEERFLVFYGDIYFNISLDRLIDFDKKHLDSLGTLVTHPNNHPYDSDLIDTDNESKIVKFNIKPHKDNEFYNNLSNAGIYILSKKILDLIPKSRPSDFGRDIFPRAVNQSFSLYSYKTSEYIKDIGTPERVREIEKDIELKKDRILNLLNEQKAIFLDRDGTINKNMDIHPSVKNFFLLPNVEEAIKRINDSIYLSIVITNQPMIAKGLLSFKELDNIHKYMQTLLGQKNAYLNDIFFCPHHPDKGYEGEVKELKINCECRKPKPGLFLKAAKYYNINLSKSWMIGDSLSDYEAAKNAGCKFIRVGQNNKDLLEAVKEIIG